MARTVSPTTDPQACFQFVSITAGQAAYLAGRVEPFESIPNIWTADLQIIKAGHARSMTVDVIRALVDAFGHQLIEDLRLLE